MSILSDSDRADTLMEWMRDNTSLLGTVTKTDLRAAVDALDAFMNTNAVAVNNAIPQPARGQLTTSQKAKLLVYVVTKRWIKGV